MSTAPTGTRIGRTQPAGTVNRWLVLLILGGAFFMATLDGTSMLTAVSSIQTSFAMDPASTQWSLVSYGLVFSGALLLCGRCADLLGRRRLLLIGLAMRVVSSALCGAAPSAELLIAARALHGLSAAVVALRRCRS